MKKIVLLSTVVTVCFVFAVTTTVFGGIEPVPWMPEINKLNSIELNLAAVHKRMQHVLDSPSLPPGTMNYLDATANKGSDLDMRLMDVISVLPPVGELGDGGEEVIFSLDGIRTDAQETSSIMEDIAARMGVAPTPWKAPFLSIINRVDTYLRTPGH